MAAMRPLRGRPATGGSDAKSLTPTERIVRKHLLELATVWSQLPGKPSLDDWVERRMPGEIRLFVDTAGRVVLEPLSAHENSSRKLFFAPDDPFYDSLLPDFTKAEVVLRGCLLDLLATGPLPMSDILADSQLSGYRSAALPKHIPLQGWIERRIGAEVSLKMEGGQLFCQIIGDQEPTNTSSRVEDPDLDLDEAKADFFERLPEDALTQEELDLRQALIAFLESRKKPGPPNLSEAGMNETVHKSRAALLPRQVSMKEWIVHRVGQEFWTKRHADGQIVFGVSEDRGKGGDQARIPCRYWLKGKCAKGDCRFFHDPALEGQGGVKHGKRGEKGKGDKSKGSDVASSGKGKDNGRREADRRPWDQEEGSAEITGNKNSFFSSLPSDSLTRPELDLRQALIDALNEWRGPGNPCLADVGKWDKIQSARRALLPKGLSMQSWIDKRIGAEIKTWELEAPGSPGAAKVFFGFPGDEPAKVVEQEVCNFWRQGRCGRGDGCKYAHPAEEEGADAKEVRMRAGDFFSDLPQDRLLPEEQRLRKGLLEFLENWRGPGKPTLAEVGSQEFMRSAKQTLLPKGVSIAKWISNRIGGEIKTYAVEGQGPGAQKVFFCLAGDQFTQDEIEPSEPKKQPCKYWADGYCKSGSQCRFAHRDADRGTKRDAGDKYYQPPGKRSR